MHGLCRSPNRGIECGTGFSRDAFCRFGAGGAYYLIDAFFQSGQPCDGGGRLTLFFGGAFEQRQRLIETFVELVLVLQVAVVVHGSAAPAVTSISSDLVRPFDLTRGQAFDSTLPVLLPCLPAILEQLVANMLDAETFFRGMTRPCRIGRVAIASVALIAPEFAQRRDAATFDFVSAFEFALAKLPLLAHRADFALKSIIAHHFASFEAAAGELELAPLFGTMRELVAHLA
jgi:hypothetical protein